MLVAKPFVRKEGVNYRIIQITDTAAHTAVKTPTPSLGKKIQKAHEADTPDRLFFPVDPMLLTNPREFILSRLQQDADFIKLVQEEEAKGTKVLIRLPEHIPTTLGKDTIEFLNSKNGKRVLRGIAKEERKD